MAQVKSIHCTAFCLQFVHCIDYIALLSEFKVHSRGDFVPTFFCGDNLSYMIVSINFNANEKYFFCLIEKIILCYPSLYIKLHIFALLMHWACCKERDRYYPSCHKNSSVERNIKRLQPNFGEGRNRHTNTPTQRICLSRT